MNKDLLNNNVIECFVSKFNLHTYDVDVNASISETYHVDSIGIIEFVVMLEDKFEITFDDNDLGESKLKYLSTIIQTVEKCLGKERV